MTKTIVYCILSVRHDQTHNVLDLSVCPSVCPSVRLFVCPFVRPSVRPSVRLSVCPFVCYQLVNALLRKQINRFQCKLA